MIEHQKFRDKISQILVRWSMPTRQAAINEIVELTHNGTSSDRERICALVREYWDKTGCLDELLSKIREV